MDGDKIISFSRTELKEAESRVTHKHGITFDEGGGVLTYKGETVPAPKGYVGDPNETKTEYAARMTMLTAKAIALVMDGAEVADCYMVLSKVVTGLIATTSKPGCKEILRDTFIEAFRNDVDSLIKMQGK